MISLFEETLDSALTFAELRPVLPVLAEMVGAEECGFTRTPRPQFGVREGFVLDVAGTAGARGHSAFVFSGGDEKKIRALHAKLKTAIARIERSENALSRNAGLIGLIETRLGACAALAAPRGGIVWISTAARQLLGDDGEALLEERVAETMKALVREPEKGPQRFMLKPEGRARVFGQVTFLRESEKTSVHYLAIELSGSDADSPSLAGKLTPSEREIHDLMVQGFGYDEIAASRHVSLETVRSHVKSIFKKAGVSSRVELLTRHLREGHV